MSDATKPYMTTCRALIRHEIVDRAEMIRGLWFETIEQRVNYRDDDMGDPSEAVRNAVERVGKAMMEALIALWAWESESTPAFSTAA